jgi:hypothetical protein
MSSAETARRVAALLRELLVFELDRRRAGALVAANRMAHVQEPAVTRIAVGDQRRLGRTRHRFDPRDHVGVARESRVGQPQMRGDRSVAGHVEGVETHRRRHPERDHVVRAGRCDHPVPGAGFEDIYKLAHGAFTPAHVHRPS